LAAKEISENTGPVLSIKVQGCVRIWCFHDNH
jgi:hypothetical protein